VPAVSPRARVRLRAVAVALSVSSSLIVGIGAAPAQAAAPTSPAASTSASISAVTSAATPFATLQAVDKHKAPKAKAGKASTAGKAKAAKAAKAKAHKVVVKKAAKQTASKSAGKAAVREAFGARVVSKASTYRGTPYQYGAAGPNRFDCSGFTRFIYAKFGISLPHSSSGQYSSVRHIASSDKRVGDLVFFHTGSGHVYHVGIYAGGGEIWAATHTGDYVRLEGMWNASYYVGRVG
jgi:cell wall-associated NlpC family hydrolase